MGGGEFDDHQGSDLEEEVDKDSLLNVLYELLLPLEDQGPPISEQLQKLLPQNFPRNLIRKNAQQFLKKYKVPKNCESLVAPKVNPEI